MRVLSLCSGIGGMDLGLQRAGMEIAGQVEIDKFCLKVLEKHWPHVKRMENVFDVKGDEFGRIDLVAAGFPCQPYSCAGKRRGAEDDRAIWPEIYRIVKTIKPAWCLFENVPGIVSMGLDGVLAALEDGGYETATFDIPACALDSPQPRHRIWIVANARSGGLCQSDICKGQQRRTKTIGSSKIMAYSDRGSSARLGKYGWQTETPEVGDDWDDYEWIIGGDGKARRIKPGICGVANGVSHRVDRLRALGNAVIPQIVEVLGHRIICREGRDWRNEDGKKTGLL